MVLRRDKCDDILGRVGHIHDRPNVCLLNQVVGIVRAVCLVINGRSGTIQFSLCHRPKIGEDHIGSKVRPVIAVNQVVDLLGCQGTAFFLHRYGHGIARTDARCFREIAVVDAQADVAFVRIDADHAASAIRVVTVEDGHVAAIASASHRDDIPQVKSGPGEISFGDIQLRLAVFIDLSNLGANGDVFRQSRCNTEGQQENEDKRDDLLHS